MTFTRIASLLLVVAVPGLARAEPKVHPPLVELPREKLAQLAPLLRSGDFALLESDGNGHEKQITTITLSKAPPEVVRDVVIHPEKYQDFVRNMEGRSVKQNPDGTFDHSWKLSYTLASFSGVNRYKLLPPRDGETAGEVEMLDPTGMSTYRWDFIPAATGGGTIVVLYGFTDVRHSGGFIDKVLKRAETLEHGLALITQMTMHRGMALEAEKKHAAFTPYSPPPPGTQATSYRFLLDRGALAILRHQGDHLAGMTLINRSPAAQKSLADEYAHPERWKYVPSIARVQQHDAKDGLDVVELEQTLPLMGWTSRWGAQQSANGVDLFGLDGDQHGDRMRYDFQNDKADGKDVQQIILRAQVSYGKSSLVMRELFKVEPLFEDGVNVGLTFVELRAVQGEVEQRTGAH
jgi:hypothetical protein